MLVFDIYFEVATLFKQGVPFLAPDPEAIPSL